MSGVTLMKETRGPREPPRAAWLICAVLAVIAILPDLGWRHSTIEWLKAVVGEFDNASVVASTPAPPLRGAPRMAVNVDSNNRCHVGLRLNGRGPFRFIVDTGAEELVLTRSQAARLGFDLNRMSTDHTSRGWGGGSVRGVFVEIHEVRLGDFVLRGFQAALETESGDEGLLGVTFLQRLRGFELASGQCRFWW